MTCFTPLFLVGPFFVKSKDHFFVGFFGSATPRKQLKCQVLEEAGTSISDRTRSYAADTSLGSGESGSVGDISDSPGSNGW